MKLRQYLFIICSLFISVAQTAKAGGLDSLQLRARVGYSIGGTTPIPLPETIRSIDSYSLTPSFMVGIDGMLPLSETRDQHGIANPLMVQSLEKVRRNTVLKSAKNFGAGIRQLARLTGVSYGIIQKL